MKKMILSLLFVAGLATMGMAQERPHKQARTPEEHAQKMTDRMAKELSLNDAQKAKIYQINLDEAKNRQANHEKTKAKMEAMKTEMKNKRAEHDAKINQVLTADQQKAYADYTAKMKNHQGGRKHAKPVTN